MHTFLSEEIETNLRIWIFDIHNFESCEIAIGDKKQQQLLATTQRGSHVENGVDFHSCSFISDRKLLFNIMRTLFEIDLKRLKGAAEDGLSLYRKASRQHMCVAIV
jgi:hypothetical protein